MTRGRRALAWGLAAAAAWVALAAVSGAWSPLARRPLLDGLIPGAAYRWVVPPPELADANVPPSAGEFTLPLRAGSSLADVVFTDDNQVTVVAPSDAVRDPDAKEVRLVVTPEDPASFGDLPGELAAFGNVYRIEATLEPSGEPLDAFDDPLTVILVYPATPNLHATEHELLTSPDGRGWTSLRTEDAPAQQQAQAEIATPGLVVIGGVPVQVAPSTPVDGGDSGANRLSNVLLVIAAASLLIGIGLLLRARGSERETGNRP